MTKANHFSISLTLLLAWVSIASADNTPEFDAAFAALAAESCAHCHDESTDNGFDVGTLNENLDDRANAALWQKVYDRVKSGEMPPPEEDRPDPQLSQTATNAIARALTQHDRQRQNKFGRTVLRRLTRTELQHTLNDLLLIDIDLNEILPPENSSSTFDTIAEKQGLSEIHVRAYLDAADAAIEQAIELRPKPETTERTFKYPEMKSIRQHLAKKNKNQKKIILKELEDSIVMFDTVSYLFKLDDFYVSTPGRYRITATASSYQARQPVTLTINVGHYEKGYTNSVGEFDLPPMLSSNANRPRAKKRNAKNGNTNVGNAKDAESKLGKPRTVSVETTLRRGHYVFPGALGLKLQPDGKTIWNNGPDNYTGDGIAMESLTIEGPLHKHWPPQSTRQLLKGIELKPYKNKQWDPTRQSHIQYQIVAGEDPEAQLQRVITWLAPRAFRRSLRPGEGKPFLEMGMAALADNRSFDEAIRVTCKSILTSPEFLFMSPAPGKLDEFSLASRLSYFLWKSIPDQELFEIAGSGKLTEPDVLKSQVNRMLDDPKADRFIADFCGQWLRLAEISATSPDARLYPEFDELLQKSMVGETESFVKHLIEENLGVSNLIDSKFAFLNRRLADHYEIEGVAGQTIKKVKLAPESVRGGLLTQASILKVTANGTTTSPVRRGAWVLTHLLGQPPSPPPPNIPAVEPDTRGAKTIRELLEKHRSDPSCNRCHQAIDPPGFALESFDVIGGFQENYRTRESGERVEKTLFGRKIWEYKHGLPVNATGALASGESFSNIREYKHHLMKQEKQVARNVIRQLFVYATGAEIQFADRAKVEAILNATEEKNWGMRDLIHHVVQSDLFLKK